MQKNARTSVLLKRTDAIAQPWLYCSQKTSNLLEKPKSDFPTLGILSDILPAYETFVENWVKQK